MEKERKEIEALISNMLEGHGCTRANLDKAVLFYKELKEELHPDLASLINSKYIDYELPCEYEELIWPK